MKKTYFKRNNELVAILRGRYGRYANYCGNTSEKKMGEMGFEIVSLTREDAEECHKLFKQEKEEIMCKGYEEEMKERANQINICLNSEPLEVGQGNALWGSITNITGSMKDAYKGCGKISAYIKDGKIIAYHYGHRQPDNAPDCECIQCEVSCFQILM